MCLTDKVRKRRQEPGEVFVGYKVFILPPSGRVLGMCYMPVGVTKYTSQRWYTATADYCGKFIECNSWDDSPPVRYRTGFHIFRHFEDARRYGYHSWMVASVAIFRVQYRGVVATGMQDGCMCDVATEMRLLGRCK